MASTTSSEFTHRPPQNPRHPFLFALDYVRNDSAFDSDYLRLGDSVFAVSPTSIQVRQQTRGQVEDVLRTPGGVVMTSGWSYTEIMIKLTFTNVYDIYGLNADSVAVGAGVSTPGFTDNLLTLDPSGRLLPPLVGQNQEYYGSAPVNPNSLAALIAQFKRTPILPIVNPVINYEHNIYAVALSTIMVETPMEDTVPIPNTLEVILICKSISVEAFCPSIEPNFDMSFIWPLQRWFWRQEFTDFLPGEWRDLIRTDINMSGDIGDITNTVSTQDQNAIDNNQNLTGSKFIYHYPWITGNTTGDYRFAVVDKDWIRSVTALRETYYKIISWTYSNQFNNLTQEDKFTAYTNILTLQNFISGYIGADTAKMMPWPIDTEHLILQHVSVVLNNNFVPLQVPLYRDPVYQHMSRGDVTYTVTFWCTSTTALNQLEQMVMYCKDLLREQRFEIVSGFAAFENEIAGLFNCRYVVFTDIQARSIPGIPNNYIVTMEMVGFNRFQRRYEALKQVTDMIDYGNTHLVNSNKGESSYYDPAMQQAIKFYQRYFGTGPNNNQSMSPWEIQSSANVNSNSTDTYGRPLNAWFNGAWIQEAKEVLENIEVYPDLSLPTFDRLMIAINEEGIFSDEEEIVAQSLLQNARHKYWDKGGKFVSPDFYIDYPNEKLAAQLNFNLTDGAIGSSFSSIAAQFLISVGQQNINNVALIAVDGSLGDTVLNILHDEFPEIGYYGFAPGDGTLNQSQNAENLSQEGTDTTSSGGQRKVSQGVGTGERYKQPVKARHAKTKIPTLGQQESTIIKPVTSAPAVTTVRHGQNITTPADSDLNSIDIKQRRQFLIDQYTAQQDTFGKHVQSIFGNPAADKPEDRLGLVNQAIACTHPVDIGITTDAEYTRLAGMLNDLMEFDCTGRLVQAYPGYVVQLMDEGPRLGWVKLFPNFWAVQSIQSIDVIQDRRDPAHTCLMEMMNMYGNMSSVSSLQLDLNAWASNTDWKGQIIPSLFGAVGAIAETAVAPEVAAFNTNVGEASQRLIQYMEIPFRNLFPTWPIGGTSEADQLAELRRRQRGQIMVAPGIRLHIRMGYGANAGAYPILFNGRITEIEYGERVQVVAQGDGIELLKMIPNAESDTATINPPSQVDGPFIATGFSPRHLICSLMSSHDPALMDYSIGAAWKDSIYKLFNGFTDGRLYMENPIGISHFGNPFLFDWWASLQPGSIAGGPFQAPAKAPDWQFDLQGPKKLSTLDKVMQISGERQTDNYRLAMAFNDKTLEIASGLGALGPPGDALFKIIQSAGSKAWGALSSPVYGEYAQAAWGSNPSMFTGLIEQAYGECGENVYDQYSPFTLFVNKTGPLIWKAATGQFFGNGLSGIQPMNAPSGDPSELPNTNVTEDADVGVVHHGSTPFNMYTHNKSVWDIVSLSAQVKPPFIAAVRPFEYRSTLFVGMPYFSYRYDYERVEAADLGGFESGENDKYYGYPYAYKSKPFMQMHIMHSGLNLVSNTVSASERDTYTDVIAMWYKGQGYGKRPDPVSEHQTVDVQIMPAMRKTAIINTDYVGADVAPTGPAVIASAGSVWAAYLVKHIHPPFIDVGGINGQVNYGGVTDAVRQMTRAILRDYQRLMYQGSIVSLGMPAVKPYDLIYLEDNFNAIRGICQVRRAVWHLGTDTGFLTSIEPDVIVEVKGDMFLTSLWTWTAAIGAMTAGMTTSRIAYGVASRKLYTSIMNFGKKLVDSKLTNTGQSLLTKAVNWATGKIPEQWVIDNIPISAMESVEFFVKVRNVLLTGLEKLLFNAKFGGPKSYAEFYQFIEALKEDSKVVVSKNGFQEAVELNYDKTINDLLTYAFDKYGETFQQEWLKAMQSNVGRFTGEGLDLIAGLSKLGTLTMLGDTVLRFTKSVRPIYTSDIAWRFGKQVVKYFGAPLWERLIAKFGGTAAKAAVQGVVELAPEEAGSFALPALGAFLGGIVDPLGGEIPGVIIGIAADVVMSIAIGDIWTAVSRWWDDQNSLQFCFLKYRNMDLQAGLNGMRPGLVVRAADDESDTDIQLDQDTINWMITKQGLNIRAWPEQLLYLQDQAKQGNAFNNFLQNNPFTQFLNSVRPPGTGPGLGGGVANNGSLTPPGSVTIAGTTNLKIYTSAYNFFGQQTGPGTVINGQVGNECVASVEYILSQSGITQGPGAPNWNLQNIDQLWAACMATCTKISPAQAQPGDIFIANQTTGDASEGHCGIVSSNNNGNPMILNNSSSNNAFINDATYQYILSPGSGYDCSNCNQVGFFRVNPTNQ